jgi:polysaccharide biosynthesis protein PslH
MKILQICSKIPFPPKDGGSIAMNMLTHGLMNVGNQVQVLAIDTPKQHSQKMDEEYAKKTAYRSVFIDTSVKPVAAFLNLFSSYSYNVNRFYSKEFENVLIEILTAQQFDIIQLEGLWIAPYVETIRKYTTAKIILRSHNVEYMIWERLSEITTSFFKKKYLQLLAKRLKAYEISMLNQYDAIATITELDGMVLKKLGCTVPMIHIPFGIPINQYIINQSNLEKGSVFHIGAMDWRPNVDGVNWFLKNVWRAFVEKKTSQTFYLAGRNMPTELQTLAMENVVIAGEVADAHQFMNSKEIMIVPLTSGGGMRVKIIEGLALGKIIISTAIGAEGIEYEDGKNIIIANTASEFTTAILKCINEPVYAARIGQHARLLAETKYDNQLISKKLSLFYETLMQA